MCARAYIIMLVLLHFRISIAVFVQMRQTMMTTGARTTMMLLLRRDNRPRPFSFFPIPYDII